MARRAYLSGMGSVQRIFSRTLASQPPQLPPTEFTPKPYSGQPYEEVLSVRKENLNPAHANLTYYKKPVLIDQGKMQWVWDSTGRRYLDMFAGIVTISVGHCHPKVVARAKDQIDRLWHTTNVYLHAQIHEYAEKLVSRMPGDLKVVYLVNSGSEANDLALYMARLYTGRYEILSLRNAYHGMSPHTMGVTALSSWRNVVPVGFGVHNVMNPDPYRGVWGGSNCRDSPSQTTRPCSCQPGQCQACDQYVEQFDDVVRHSMPKQGFAAFIAESIQGVGGAVQFPRDYLKRACQSAHNSGALCILDEVQTGFGRLGDHFWGFESHGVQPDIVTMAKGMGNGIPIAAVVTTPEVAKPFANALHLNTFGGNPISCAVASTVLDVMDEDGCQQNSAVVGTHLINRLMALRDKYEWVGDVRGKGLMIGMEMVTDKTTRRPLPADKMAALWERTKDLGVLIGKGGLYGNCFRIKPPMCITKQDADFLADVFDYCLDELSADRPVV